MYANGQHEAIQHQEEFIFALAQANAPQFPALSALWEAYYDDPRISSAQASALLHELIALLAINGGSANKPPGEHRRSSVALFQHGEPRRS